MEQEMAENAKMTRRIPSMDYGGGAVTNEEQDPGRQLQQIQTARDQMKTANLDLEVSYVGRSEEEEDDVSGQNSGRRSSLRERRIRIRALFFLSLSLFLSLEAVFW
ncbi:hypothetical protein PIB30_063187 [Stylosanthes scabra]|uniref:Bet1-like protein n=1 Tax=Stylosanthes scabra TaxID=79078 RepID=A0ABU6SLQ3_9FABA|nr:hypothetical protein [Stylosanthes scabra]